MNKQEAARIINKYLTQDELNRIFVPGEIVQNCWTRLLDTLAERCSWEDWSNEVSDANDFIENMKVEEFASFCCLYLHREFKAVTHYVCSSLFI